MPPPEAAQESYQFIQRLQALIVASSRRAWSRMSTDFDGSWTEVGPQLTSVVSAGQLAAAQRATTYVPAVLAETGQPDLPDARVRPQAFSGVAADGRSLTGLLRSSVVHAKTGSASGLSSDLALGVGQRWLDALVETVITDAFRLATEAETAVRDNLGFVRQVNPPCCGRCAVLAGRWYRFDAGFERHPRCDCIGIPASENVAGSLVTDPARLFNGGQVRGLTRRERERLAAGDDPVKVINESRDMWRARIQEQKAAAKQAAKDAERATPAGEAAAAQGRASMEAILNSAGNRQQAQDFMRRFGFIE